MTSSSETSIGPGSSIDLSPEILKLRDSYLEALQNRKDAIEAMSPLEKEENESNRIALLACRTLLLREKTVILRSEIDEDQTSNMLKNFKEKAFSKKDEANNNETEAPKEVLTKIFKNQLIINPKPKVKIIIKNKTKLAVLFSSWSIGYSTSSKYIILTILR